jgi:hypothetical protein
VGIRNNANGPFEYAGTVFTVLLLVMLATSPLITMAAEPERVSVDKPLLDPWVPPANRRVEAAVPTQGESLRTQVERKLLASFVAADSKGVGTITKAQAQAAGMGFLVNNFDQIDQRKRGAVNFDEVKSYLRLKGAQLP